MLRHRSVHESDAFICIDFVVAQAANLRLCAASQTNRLGHLL